jgi:hypothetical protein
MDRDRLRLLGSATATTCPKRLEIIKPYYEMVWKKQIPELVWPLKTFDMEQL